jgi:hypothetical protein
MCNVDEYNRPEISDVQEVCNAKDAHLICSGVAARCMFAAIPDANPSSLLYN